MAKTDWSNPYRSGTGYRFGPHFSEPSTPLDRLLDAAFTDRDLYQGRDCSKHPQLSGLRLKRGDRCAGCTVEGR